MSGEHDFKPVLKSKLEAVNRDKEEEKARKKDAEKIKRKREDNLPDAVAQLNRLNDPVAIAKRGRLNLPAPQVHCRARAQLETRTAPHLARHLASHPHLSPRTSHLAPLTSHRSLGCSPARLPWQVTDKELEDVVKASSSSQFDDDGGSASTRMLMNQYDQTPAIAGAMPTRTPRVGGGGGEDTVLAEAAAQAALLARETPLRGGDSAGVLAPEALGDFSGVTPRHSVAATPNPIADATPSRQAGGATPAAGSLKALKGGATPSGRSEAGGSIAGESVSP